jgi:8-oxo-dGTP pyrophosphatase MutT (NUDIX family)
MGAGTGLEGIAEALARREAGEDLGVPAERKAAVAAILREGNGEVQLLLIRRAEQPGDPWSGHMGLPGGRVDPGDASPLAAALRETREELGLDLEALGRPLGRLSEVRTHLPLGSVPHSVVPFAFAIEGDPALSPNEEVQDALWLPLPFLLDRGNRSWFTWVRKGLPLPMPCYRWEGRVLWGLTLKIVDELLEVVEG